MTNQYVERIASGWPLLIGGAFMVYLAAADDTVFNYILGNTDNTRLTVAAATVAASAPLMFFATGFFKLAVFYEWQTIYQYEILLRKNIFSVMAIILLIGIMGISAVEDGVHLFNAHILVGCTGFSAYLVTRMAKSGNA